MFSDQSDQSGHKSKMVQSVRSRQSVQSIHSDHRDERGKSECSKWLNKSSTHALEYHRPLVAKTEVVYFFQDTVLRNGTCASMDHPDLQWKHNNNHKH